MFCDKKKGGTPTVSVLCAAYNASEFIEECIDSVLMQDYPNIQFVITDDCSTDETVSIARETAQNYPDKNIVISTNKVNLGITGNCNAGLELCNGDYICLIAADDILHRGKISSQIRHFIQYPKAVLSYHGVDVIDDDGNHLYRMNDDKQKYFSFSDIIIRGGLPYTSSVIVKSTAIPAHGYDSKIPTVSDWIFLIETSIKGSIIKFPGIWASYRKHDNGKSNETAFILNEVLMSLDIVEKRYANSGFNMEMICKKGKERYIKGEIVRCTLNGRSDRLKNILKGSPLRCVLINIAIVLGIFLVATKVNESKFFKTLCSHLSTSVKS